MIGLRRKSELGRNLADLRGFAPLDPAVGLRYLVQKSVNALTLAIVEGFPQPAAGLVAAPAIGDLSTVFCDFHRQHRLGWGQPGMIDEDLLHAGDLSVAKIVVGHSDSVKNACDGLDGAGGLAVECFEAGQSAANLISNTG